MIRDRWIPGILLPLASEHAGIVLPSRPLFTVGVDSQTEMYDLHMFWFYRPKDTPAYERMIGFRVSWESSSRFFKYAYQRQDWIHLREVPIYLVRSIRSPEKFSKRFQQTLEDADYVRVQGDELWEPNSKPPALRHPFDGVNVARASHFEIMMNDWYQDALRDTVAPDEMTFRPFADLLS